MDRKMQPIHQFTAVLTTTRNPLYRASVTKAKLAREGTSGNIPGNGAECLLPVDQFKEFVLPHARPPIAQEKQLKGIPVPKLS